MTTLAGSNLTLMDWAKRTDPDGGITPNIVEMLEQTNEMVKDMVVREANSATHHRCTVRTGLPTATYRQYYQGVAPSKSTTVQVDESIGMLEARSVVDKDLAELNGDVNAFRMTEAGPFMEAMNQTMQDTVIYGNIASDPKTFNGFAPRYDLTTDASGENIVSGGGSDSDNTSIWLIGWGDSTVYGVFPKGSKAGVSHEDLGIDHNTPDGQSPVRYFSAYHDKWEWKMGLVVSDWRYAVRIANIDISNLIAESSAADILKLMTIAVHKIPNLSAVRPAFYCNRAVMTMLDIQAQNKQNVQLTMGNEESRPKVSFRGIPIRLCDLIRVNEATVS